MNRAAGVSDTPQRNRNNIPAREIICERWKDLQLNDDRKEARFGLLMRRMALDWTLSRRQRVDFAALPQTWEQYSKERRIC